MANVGSQWVRFAAGAVVAAIALCATPAKADMVVYQFVALRGAAADCVWFNNNINDRSEDAIARQVDMIYNRVALKPDEPVTNVQTAQTQAGKTEAGFEMDRIGLCAGIEAIRPPAPEPAASPSS